jgi:hypothetical protein
MNAAIILAAYAGGCAALLAGDLLRRSDPDGRNVEPPLVDSLVGAAMWPLLAVFTVLDAVARAGCAGGADGEGDGEG